MRFDNGQFLLGDCLELMKDIPSGSVDMILCDLPYGTTQNKWDSVIPFEPLWEQYLRIAKLNAAIVLTAAQPFTSLLIMSKIEFFKYDWIWHKSRPSGHLNAKKQPMKAHENVCVFYREQCAYNPQMETGKPNHVNAKPRTVGHSNNYGKQGKVVEEITNQKYPTTIKPFTVISPTDIKHPTQKPVALFEYLIKTYSNEGETVLDNCAGSGTTAIAAERTGRKWICMEKDQTYYNSAIRRVAREYY